jgi:hypothetical protein
VPRKLAEHSLHVRPDAKPVKQPLRRFADERRKAIKEELTRLLAAGFIMEVLHPDWLSNPVLVEKKKDDPNCRRGEQTDAIGRLMLGPMCTGGSGEGWRARQHAQNDDEHTANTTIYPGSGLS